MRTYTLLVVFLGLLNPSRDYVSTPPLRPMSSYVGPKHKIGRCPSRGRFLTRFLRFKTVYGYGTDTVRS
jgi:hypothetical protein